MDLQTSSHPSPIKPDHAIQDLIKSFRGLLPDGSNSQSQSSRFIDVQHACDELLKLTFHSEDGRLQLIEKLTKLDGNFVVKIIRKGLVSLSKVYSDSETFEEESLKLIDLCCSQLHGLQTGYDRERLVASPAAIIDWAKELCDELVTNGSPSPQSIASISSSVLKIKYLYESIRRWGVIKEESKVAPYNAVLLPNSEIFTFEGIISVLKPRIHSVGFEDVIEQTASIVRTDAKRQHYICTTVLSKWLKLLKISSVTNWFAAQVANHDFFVHCESTKEVTTFPGTIDDKSLICQVFDAIKTLMSSDDKYECLPDEKRLMILFDFPELFQLRPKTCIKLIQSREVCNKVIEDIFSTLTTDLTKDAIKGTDDPYYPYNDFNTGLEETARKLKLIDENMRTSSFYDLRPDQKHHQKLSINAITQALLTIPDKQQVLKVLHIWKHNFPDDASHRILSELFVLVIEVIEMKRETIVVDMEQLVIFLTEHCIKHKNAVHLWRELLPSLMDALPNSWYHPENMNPMKTHVNKIRQLDQQRQTNNCYYSVCRVESFLSLVKSKSLPDRVKTKVFQLGLDLLGEIPPNYRFRCSDFIFYTILSLLSVMDIAQTRQYSLELLKIVKELDSAFDFHGFNPIIGIIVAIRNSCVIERKQEMLEDLLRLLKETKKDNQNAMLSACSGFLKFLVNTENTRRFFVLAATGAHSSYRFILTCMRYNRGILNDQESVNSLVNFLFQIMTEELTSNTGHLELLTTVIIKSIRTYNREFNYPTIEIFEKMVTAVAHDIAVGKFDMDLNEAALRVTIAAVDSHQQGSPIDFQSLYVDLNRAFRESKHVEQQSFIYDIMKGLCLLAKLPLTLKHIKCLIQRVMAITHYQEVQNVLFKLFQMNSNGLLSSLDHNDLYLTLERLLVPTTISSADTSLRHDNVFIMDSYDSMIAIEQALSSLELPTEGMDMAKREETQQDSKFSFTSQVVQVVEYKVCETDPRDEGKDHFKHMLLRVPPILTPLIGRCLTECYKVGFNDQPSIKTITEEVIKSAGNWRKLEIHVEALAQTVSYVLLHDEKLGPFLSERMRQCHILGLREKPSPKIAILSILKGYAQWKKLKTEITDIEKEVFSVLPDLVPYISACAEECHTTPDVGGEPSVKSLTLQILKSFEFYKRLEKEIEKMEREVSSYLPEFIPSIGECMRQCYIAGLGEKPETKPVILKMFEIIDGWKELESKIPENEEITSSSSEFISLVMACMKHWQVFGQSEEGKRIQDFIVQIIEAIESFTWNRDDMNKVNKSCLNIPRQLYLIFKEARNNEEAKKGLVKAFDIIRKLDPSIHAEKEWETRFQSLVQLDFYLLLKDSSVTAADVCSALLICKGLEDRYLSNFLPIFRESEYDIFDSVEPTCYMEILGQEEEEKSEFPSPGYVAYLIINQLRRLGIPDSNLQETTQSIYNKLLCYVFQDRGLSSCCDCKAPMTVDDELRFLFNLMNESSYLAEFEYWLSMGPHHHASQQHHNNVHQCASPQQCANVIIAALLWKKGRKSCEEAMCANEKVYETLSKLQETYTKRRPEICVYSCNAWMSERIEIMARVLKTTEQEDIAFQLFHLLCKSTTAAVACLDIIPSWSVQESLSLVEGLAYLYKKRMIKLKQRDLDKELKDLNGKRCKEMRQRELDNELEVALKVLPFAAKKFPSSALKAISFLENIIEQNYGHADKMNLRRLLLWYKQMTDTGYDPQAIKAWCTGLVHLQNLSSRDVDAIANMTPKTIKLLNDESGEVGKCLFPVDATETEESFKRRLILARLLSELSFIAIMMELKPDSSAVQKIKEAVKSLCLSFNRDPSTVSSLYRDRDMLFKELFVSLFDEEDGNYTESLKELANRGPLSKSLVILLRRLARCCVSKPSTCRYAKKIVHAISDHTAKIPNWQYLGIQTVVHLEVLHFEPNQDAIVALQAAGYNQSASTNEDLWYSSSIQMPAYVSTVKSFESSRKESLLRQLWREWKLLLPSYDISGVEVDDKLIQISELFKPTDSLEMIESQLEAVKQETNVENARQLVYHEKRMRYKIEEQGKEVKKMPTKKLEKLVIVWENAFLECVKMCSEKIPDCYAPNGIHSEKPVICGIAVDNRILTLYKEDKGGTRTEMENVEVKLYPAGMVVFGMFRGVHPYDTAQLWAAFYKMLLDKRLVPKIFITNISPAFDWIKQFVAPETTPPDRANFFNCCNLISPLEDSFDYSPDIVIPMLGRTGNLEIQELIILTPEKTKLLETDKIKPPDRDKLIPENIDKVVLHLRDDGRLQKMHPTSHDKILDRLMFVIRHEVEIAVDGGEPTQESISSSIDMKRLLHGCEDAHQYSKDDYSAVILDAVNTVTGDFRGSRQSYDGCHHVVFFQPNEN